MSLETIRVHPHATRMTICDFKALHQNKHMICFATTKALLVFIWLISFDIDCVFKQLLLILAGTLEHYLICMTVNYTLIFY